jgi:hypothetical protein
MQLNAIDIYVQFSVQLINYFYSLANKKIQKNDAKSLSPFVFYITLCSPKRCMMNSSTDLKLYKLLLL